MPRPYILQSREQKIERLTKKKEWYLRVKEAHLKRIAIYTEKLGIVNNRISSLYIQLQKLNPPSQTNG